MELTDRDYQPSLLWAKVSAWYEAQPMDSMMATARPLQPHDLTLHVYRTDKSGAWLMHGPKLYWTDTPHGQYFGNTDQTALADNAEVLGEVVLWDRRIRKTILVGNTYQDAMEKISAL